MIFKRIYEFLFFAFYRWSVKVNGTENHHVLYASLMLGFVLMLNITAALVILEYIEGVELLAYLAGLTTLPMLVGSAIYFSSHYAYFKSKNRYIRVLDEYGRESGRLSRRQVVMVSGYVFGSFFLLVGMLFLLPPPT